MGKRPRFKMTMEDRAKQFAPFAALGDLSEAFSKVEEAMRREEERQKKGIPYEDLPPEDGNLRCTDDIKMV